MVAMDRSAFISRDYLSGDNLVLHFGRTKVDVAAFIAAYILIQMFIYFFGITHSRIS
jgi:hypothetical protein